ncbi:MAG TPA: ABC transporter permease [Terriglobales bacterium]|nr:ABC transporter permease [Terriglobales bacterium]
MSPARSNRVLQFFLRLLPADFRQEYGREIESDFRHQAREAGATPGGAARLWRSTIAGIVRTAPSEHFRILRQDLGYAWRMMRRSPGYSFAVIFILALGLGANTAIFSAVDGVLLRPLPYPGGDRLVTLTQGAPLAGAADMRFSVDDINDYRQQTHTLEDLVEYHNMQFDLLGQGDPRRVNTGVVSHNFFDALGVKPLYGRTFVAADDSIGAPAVLVLSYEFWKRDFGGDPGIVGRTFRMNDRIHTVIGVLPPMPQYPDQNDLYMPVSACPFRSAPAFIANRKARMMTVFGHLRPGVTLAQSEQELKTIAARLRTSYPAAYPASADFSTHADLVKASLTNPARPTLLLLLATSGLMLFIVCANVANLNLTRHVRRERELAVRAALGAGRARLLRQMITESALLSLIGCGLGVMMAKAALPLLAGFAARFTPRATEITLNIDVLAFSLGLALLAGLFFGALPALASGRDLAEPLRAVGGRTATGRSGRFRGLLVGAQVAFAFLLLAGAGLLLRSFYNLTQVNPGFRSDHVVSMLVQLNFARYATNDKVVQFNRRLLQEVQRNPAVLSAATASTFPLNAVRPRIAAFEIQGRQRGPNEPAPTFDFHSVSPGYFKTMGIAMLAGRQFSPDDALNTPDVVIINRSMQDRYWPHHDAIGHSISTDGKNWAMIVGIVDNVKSYGLDKPPGDELYASNAQSPSNSSSLLVQTRGDPAAVVPQLTAAVHQIDPDQPVAKIRTLESLRDDSLAPARLTGTLLGLLALLALAITAAGIGGVLGLEVAQRTKEIGIRMTLGARRSDVIGGIVRQGLTPVAFGLAAGCGVAIVSTNALQGILFRVEPRDPAVLALVALALLSAAAVACLGPVRRAVSVDPMRTLRLE